MANLQVSQGTGTWVATIDIGNGVHATCAHLVAPNGSSVCGSAGSPSLAVISTQGVLGGIPVPVSLSSGTASIGLVVVSGTTAVGGSVSITGVPNVAISGTPSVSVVGISAVNGTVSITGTPTVSVTGTSAISGAVSISGTPNITGSVSISSQPAPTGTTVVSITGTPSITVTGTANVAGTVAISGTPAVTVSGTATVSPITINQMGTAAVVSAGLAGTLAIGGGAASNAVITTNPVNQGAQAISAENAAAVTGRMVQLVSDLVGKLIVLPYANPENFISGVTPTINGTQTVLLLSAPTAGLRNYITSLSVTNAVNTGTVVGIKDGTNGTTLWSGYCGTQTVGSVQLSFPVPLRQPTTGTAVNCFCITNGASVIVSAQGYKGA